MHMRDGVVFADHERGKNGGLQFFFQFFCSVNNEVPIVFASGIARIFCASFLGLYVSFFGYIFAFIVCVQVYCASDGERFLVIQ